MILQHLPWQITWSTDSCRRIRVYSFDTELKQLIDGLNQILLPFILRGERFLFSYVVALEGESCNVTSRILATLQLTSHVIE